MKKNCFPFFALLALAIVCQGLLTAQTAPLKPVNFGDMMPDFTLPAVQGGEISLSALKGKNVLLIFPRGRVGDHWCQICHYQYAELADLERELQIRKKYNLEILFVLPYDKATVEHWADIFPEQMAVIEGWKNPPAEAQKDPGTARWMETSRRLFPKKFVMSKDSIPLPFPILIDGERKLSEGLQLFTLFWDRSYVEQNIATIFLLDKTGQVRFKYFSQGTVDRPDAAFLLKFIERML
ncbi:MAG: redoxin domain-containing protein [Candidatus Aminicenantes bacterium]|nr:redoxin domain-containing protein [Candidatus Aminicenantes bacterium]